MKRIVSVLLALSLILVSNTYAFAANPIQREDGGMTTEEIAVARIDDRYSVPLTRLRGELTEEIIRKADPYINLGQNGLFEISDYDALSRVLTKTEIKQVEAQISNMNTGLKNSIKASVSENVSIDENSKLITVYAKDTQIALKAADDNEGVNKIEWKWFGARIYLSKSMVNHILNAGVAAGALFLGTQFPGFGTGIAIAIVAYLTSEFGTSHISRAMYFDIGLKSPSLTNPNFVGVRGFGFQ